jgi:hypothetical protein
MKNVAPWMFLLVSLTTLSCEEEQPTPPVQQQCEISQTGTFTIINKTPYSITVKIDGGTPSNMGSIGPGDEVSIDVTAGVIHTLAVRTVQGSSSSYNWDFTHSVGACVENELAIQL